MSFTLLGVRSTFERRAYCLGNSKRLVRLSTRPNWGAQAARNAQYSAEALRNFRLIRRLSHLGERESRSIPLRRLQKYKCPVRSLLMAVPDAYAGSRDPMTDNSPTKLVQLQPAAPGFCFRPSPSRQDVVVRAKLSKFSVTKPNLKCINQKHGL